MARKKVVKKTATRRSTTRAPKAAPNLEWFTNARLGLFIHWGLYALPARHEWVKSRELISDQDYQKYFDAFNPDLYNPQEWARAAREAGMKYFVITTKHHDGFCLWDTKLTDYKVTNTPHGKDLLRPMIEAFRTEGLGVGLYHSLIDWHHPEFVVTNDHIHPQREDAAFLKKNTGRDMKKYAKYLHGQVKELLTEFGKIDYLFFDFSYTNPSRGCALKGREGWDSDKLVAMIRKLQPELVLNDRLDNLDDPNGWDVRTPEQMMMRECYQVDGKRVPWETCQTFSGAWGYHRDENTWKSVRQLLFMLIDTVSKSGNLLLNVGPTARGVFDERANARLAGMGEWMRVNERSIVGCGEAPARFPKPDNCLLTYDEKTQRLYVHVLEWPIKHLHLDGFAGKVKYAQFLHDGSELMTETLAAGKDKETLTVTLPILKPAVEIPVLELFLK